MYEAVWDLDLKEQYNFWTLVDKDKPSKRPAGKSGSGGSSR